MGRSSHTYFSLAQRTRDDNLCNLYPKQNRRQAESAAMEDSIRPTWMFLGHGYCY